MTTDHRTPEEKERARKELADGAIAWEAAQKKKAEALLRNEGAFAQTREAFLAAMAKLPDVPVVPYHLTAEGERFERFKRTCDPVFFVEVDFTKIRNRVAYDKVMRWDGRFPGPALHGDTGIGKSFAAWQILRELYVKKAIPFKWFPVRDLVNEMKRYEDNECTADFFRQIDFFKIIYVDDIDKINWDFNSSIQMLFSFLDWVYRAKKPCIVTTNRDRAWWKAKAGDALVRRLFDDGFVEVNFK